MSDGDDRPRPSLIARREVEEGLDEVEFFVTQGLFDDALEALRELLRAHPDHPVLLDRLREVEQLAGPRDSLVTPRLPPRDDAYDVDEPPTGEIDAEAVLAQFRLSAEDDTRGDDPDAHYDLGVAYKEMGLLDDAIAEFKVAADSPARRCVGETMIGLCYMERGDPTSALEHFRLALEAPQRSSQEELTLHYETGNALESVGRASEALAHYQKAESRDPSFRDVRLRVQRLLAARRGGTDGGRS